MKPVTLLAGILLARRRCPIQTRATRTARQATARVAATARRSTSARRLPFRTSGAVPERLKLQLTFLRQDRCAIIGHRHYCLQSPQMSRLETDQRLQRALGALTPSAFASPRVFDCPLCGGRQDLYVSIHPSDNPNYLFNLCCFCDCDPQKVGERILHMGSKRRRKRARHASESGGKP
jgi:hypothetical protein